MFQMDFLVIMSVFLNPVVLKGNPSKERSTHEGMEEGDQRTRNTNHLKDSTKENGSSENEEESEL